jgi:hypothetical protein
MGYHFITSAGQAQGCELVRPDVIQRRLLCAGNSELSSFYWFAMKARWDRCGWIISLLFHLTDKFQVVQLMRLLVKLFSDAPRDLFPPRMLGPVL